MKTQTLTLMGFYGIKVLQTLLIANNSSHQMARGSKNSKLVSAKDHDSLFIPGLLWCHVTVVVYFPWI